MASSEEKKTRPPQATELLRILAGGYLVYLAWQIFQGAEDDVLLLLAAGVFAAVGAALVIWCGKALVTSGYFRNTPEESAPEASRDPDEG